jgi:hypothetical protein
MMIQTAALGIGILAFLFLYQVITRNKVSKMNSLTMQKQNAQSKYEFMLNHKRELKKELEEKKRKLATLRNNQQGIKTISADDLEIEDIDENEKVSRYLIQHGKITMEQNIKVLKKMEILQMDYLGICITLGFIDLKTAKQALKVNKIHSKSTAFD